MRISIVMPTLNQAAFIAESLESIFSQAVEDLEVLVIDGMSTDATIDVLRDFQKKYPAQIKWISAKDNGPAEAVNKGFNAATGEIIGWLNSDDLYDKVTLKKILDYFKKNRAKNVVYGQGDHIDAHGQFIEQYPTKPPKTDINDMMDGSFICQPTMFFRKSILEQVGYLDTSLKLSFDFDWWIRFFKTIPNEIGFIDETLAYSRIHANCLTKMQRKTVAIEGLRVLKRHFDHAPSIWALTYIDEICSQYPFIDDARPLVQIIESFLTEIRPYLSASDLDEVIKKLQTDKRLILSSQALYVDVSPDGWASQKVMIKLRQNKDSTAKYIEIVLAGGWPISQEMILKISSGLGSQFTSVLNTMQSGKLKLEIPQFSNDAFIEWLIETEDFFIPAEQDKSSDDTRRLSFVVTSLQFVE